MGFLDGILGARPKKNDAASLREAQAQAQRRLDQATARVAELERERGKLLRHGSVAEMESGEADLAAARLDVERLRALMATLAEEIPAAELAEMLGALKAEIAEVKRLRADFMKRWNAEYPALARKLVELLRLEQQAEDARTKAAVAGDTALAKGADPAVIEDMLSGFPGRPVSHEMNPGHGELSFGSMGFVTRLPGLPGGETNIFDYPAWPERKPGETWFGVAR